MSASSGWWTRRRRALAAVVAVAAVAVMPLAGPFAASPAGAATSSGDGTTPATAGASCWGIKQAFPASPSGTYWLLTPAMDRPAAFACDMVTDGGGWALVARGRNGWTFQPNGQGSPSTVRTTISGPGAFVPAALGATSIDELVNRADVAALPDGIRVERSTNSDGSTRQEMRLFPKFHTWNWSWPSGQPLNGLSIDGTYYAGSNTKDTYDAGVFGQTGNQLAGQQGDRRLFTFGWSGNGYYQGFTFGAGMPGGSSSSTDHLWKYGSSSYPMPFTRVWVRPQVPNSIAFPAVPAGGLPAAPKAPGLKDRSEFAGWGVLGNDHTGEAARVEPYNTNVLAVEATPSRVFVGGRFTGVRAGPTGGVFDQKSLAAFDLDGNWISTFRPTFVGRVFDILLTSDNKLLVAGDFTSVNGNTDASGLVALDPNTGAVLPGWKARARRSDGTPFRVRTIDQRGPWIYAAGNFNQVTGGTWNPIIVSHAISVSLANGTPGSWRPRLAGGSGVNLEVNQAGTRVLLAGTFTSVNANTAQRSFAITEIGTGADTPGIGAWIPPGGSNGYDYQQAVADMGDRMVVGGSQHDIQLWNPNRTTLLDAAITRQGGDTQSIDMLGGYAYIGCHCGDAVYQGTNEFVTPSGFRSVDRINLIGRWNTATWTYDSSWVPVSLKGFFGEGVWASDMDARGCLWAGGDLVRGAYSGNASIDYLGGFARFCPLDSTAPTTPSSFSVQSTGQTRKLTWAASTDAVGPVTYDVYRNDRVVVTTSATTWTDPTGPSGSKYTVRAADGRGNRSAAPAPITVP